MKKKDTVIEPQTSQAGSDGDRQLARAFMRGLAKVGEAEAQHSPAPSSHSSEFRRNSPTFTTRVPVKVPSACGWPLACAQT